MEKGFARLPVIAACCALWLAATSDASAQTQAEAEGAPEALTTATTAVEATESGADSSLPASDDDADAFWAGVNAYSRGEYASAIELFERAYSESGDARALFNISQVYRQLGDCERAHQAFDRYSEQQSELPAEAGNWLRRMRKECPSTPQTPPPEEPVPTATPPQTAGATSSDQAPTAQVAAPTTAPPNRRASADSSARDRSRHPTKAAWGWSLLAGGVASATVSLISGVQAANSKSHVQEVTLRNKDDGEPWSGGELERQNARQATIFKISTTAFAALTAAAITVLSVPAPRQRREVVRFDLGLTRHGVAARWGTRF